MKSSIIFSNAVAVCNESRLLKKEQITRLSDASSYQEALKMLYDYGYQRTELSDLDSVMAAQSGMLVKYIKEECPDKGLEAVILNPYIYNNAKVYYKARVGSAPLTTLYLIDDQDIKEGIESGNYLNLPSKMAECLNYLDGLKEKGELSGREIDASLGKAMHLHNAKIAKRKEVKEYVTAVADLTNLSIFIRCHGLNLNFDYFEQNFIPGGSIVLKQFLKIYQSGLDKLEELYKGYGDTPSRIILGNYNLEMGIEGMLLRISLKYRTRFTTLSPFLSFYLRQELEYKVVKMILTCIKNNAKKEIEPRLRGLYE